MCHVQQVGVVYLVFSFCFIDPTRVVFLEDLSYFPLWGFGNLVALAAIRQFQTKL